MLQVPKMAALKAGPGQKRNLEPPATRTAATPFKLGEGD